MIDLHLHTNASDGEWRPAELVERARASGLTTLSVTDHDTTAGLAEAARACAAVGLEFVRGIEITAIWEERDIHILGYFLDPASPPLETFLEAQRADRIDRVGRLGARLTALGMPIDVNVLIEAAGQQPGRSIGRPQVATAMVRAGYVASVREAFDRWLACGCPAFVPRSGAAPTDVIAVIRRAGGIASLAHPATIGRDDLLPEWVGAGLDALEVFHPEHAPALQQHYLRLAQQYGLAVSGGSDYHGETVGRANALGTISLPESEFAALKERAARGRPANPRVAGL